MNDTFHIDLYSEGKGLTSENYMGTCSLVINGIVTKLIISSFMKALALSSFIGKLEEKITDLESEIRNLNEVNSDTSFDM